MVFSSPVFLFLYLPLTLAVYFFIPRKSKNFFLLIVSMLFYAWGEGASSWVVIVSVVLNYLLAIRIDASQHKRNVLAFGVVANLLLLGWFKYANFIVDNFNRALGVIDVSFSFALPTIHLPLGISFFTFHAISYLIDVKRGNVEAQKRFADFALYIFLFPQLIAGPIIRYKNIATQLRDHVTSRQDFAVGFHRFVIGLGKKMLVANPLGETADKIFGHPAADLTGPVAWLGILTYTFQIYFDFSGYSDMAIGLMRMLGFHIAENFNYPYASRSVKEFWRRWHVSLSTWFCDYVYIPLGGNRLGVLRTYINLTTIFVLCGLWHGASWSFLVWGLWHGAFLATERTPLARVIESCPRVGQQIYAMLVVIVGWVFFRSDNLAYAIEYLRAMSGASGANPLLYPIQLYLDVYTLAALLLAGIGSLFLWREVAARWWAPTEEATVSEAACSVVQATSIIFILMLSVCFVAAGTYNPFIYFRF